MILEDGTNHEQLLFSKMSSFPPHHTFVLMYDITNEETLFNVEEWIRNIKEMWKDGMPIIIVGHKWDKDTDRQVTFEEAYRLAEDWGALYCETSITEITDYYLKIIFMC